MPCDALGRAPQHGEPAGDRSAAGIGCSGDAGGDFWQGADPVGSRCSGQDLCHTIYLAHDLLAMRRGHRRRMVLCHLSGSQPDDHRTGTAVYDRRFGGGLSGALQNTIFTFARFPRLAG
jgi:hypothetical protein